MKAQIYFILLVFASVASAQLDPSTKVLVRKGASVDVEAEELDSTRYEVRTVQVPVAQPTQGTKKVKRVQMSSDGVSAQTSNTAAGAVSNDVEVTEVIKVVPAPPPPPKKVIVKEVVKEEVVVVKPPPLPPKVEEVKIVKVESEPVPLSQQLQIFLLGDPNEINAFRQELHPLDSRNNKFEIDFAPFLFTANSSSQYWYRNYNFNSLGLEGDVRFWLSPFFGLAGGYQSSLGAQMSGNPAGTFYSPTSYQTWWAGVRFRKYFGTYRKAPWMTYGIDWQDQKINTTGDLNERMSIETYGVNLSVQATIPSSLNYANQFYFSLIPRPAEFETQSQNISSGNSPEVYALQLGIGGLYQLDRYHQIFWRVQNRYQKSIYKGTASNPDPVTGLTPSRVTVTESTTMLYFGLQFGQ